MSDKKRKILFLGETYRADAITWMNGLREFGSFEIITCELQTSSKSFFKRTFRFVEYLFLIAKIRQLVKLEKPDIVIAERSTSYGFLASISGAKIIVIAQQGISDLWPKGSPIYFLKKKLQYYAYHKATLIHAWGNVMLAAIRATNVSDDKIMLLPKGINLEQFTFRDSSNDTIKAIVTRSLFEEYDHITILKAFKILSLNNLSYQLTIVGDGKLLDHLKSKIQEFGIENNVHFTGKISNHDLPKYLKNSNIYISMPTTEGVSASLFEAMACGCYPIVSDILGNSQFINHQKNGQLVQVANAEMLANEIMWSFENISLRCKAVEENRNFVTQHANYKKNMTIIAKKYHQLIDS